MIAIIILGSNVPRDFNLEGIRTPHIDQATRSL